MLDLIRRSLLTVQELRWLDVRDALLELEQRDHISLHNETKQSWVGYKLTVMKQEVWKKIFQLTLWGCGASQHFGCISPLEVIFPITSIVVIQTATFVGWDEEVLLYPIRVARTRTLYPYNNRRLNCVQNEAKCSAQSELFFRLLLKNTVRWVHLPAYSIFWIAPHGAHQFKSKMQLQV